MIEYYYAGHFQYDSVYFVMHAMSTTREPSHANHSVLHFRYSLVPRVASYLDGMIGLSAFHAGPIAKTLRESVEFLTIPFHKTPLTIQLHVIQ